MAGIARPFIPWIGSKEKLIPYIWQVFPPSPKLYLEPFGGGGALLLGMQPKVSRMDIYNDFNCDLVNLFLCARECTVQLVRELKFIPFHSRAEFDLLKEFMKHKELLQQRIADERNAVMECFSGEEREELLEILRERSCLFDVQRAAAYYKVCRGSFSGTTTSFGVKPNNLTNFLYLFDDASKRLQDVVIENKDCLEIIRERDGPDSLIYCDPPYFEAEKLYEVGFPREKHIELKRILAECVGFIVVSYNDCPFIRCLYEDFTFWHSAEIIRCRRRKTPPTANSSSRTTIRAHICSRRSVCFRLRSRTAIWCWCRSLPAGHCGRSILPGGKKNLDIKKTGHTCETSPEACAQPYLLPDTTLALFWMGRGAAILSSAQMTAEDLVFAVRELGEAQAAYLQKLIEVCGACDALCECRAARVEETDALRRLPPKLLRELWEKGVCIRNLGRALASGAFLYDARNIRKRGTEHETHGETQ